MDERRKTAFHFFFFEDIKIIFKLENASPSGIMYLLKKVIIKCDHTIKSGYHSKVTYEDVVILGVGV